MRAPTYKELYCPLQLAITKYGEIKPLKAHKLHQYFRRYRKYVSVRLLMR